MTMDLFEKEREIEKVSDVVLFVSKTRICVCVLVGGRVIGKEEKRLTTPLSLTLFQYIRK